MIQRTGNKRLAVVGWGRGMGHKGHMYLASSVITQAQKMNADAYFFVSKTVGKDDPIFPEEKVKIYQTVFPQQAPIFQPQGNLNQALTDLAADGYQGVVLVVGADQKDAFKYLERPNKEGVPVYQSMGLKKLRVISRQETGDSSAGLEGPRATPMREVLLHPDATEEQKFKVWRDAMPDALGDKEVMDLMKKAEARLMGANAKKTKVAESRIMDRDARINAFYVSKKGDKHRVAENIPYYLLDKLVPLLTKKYAITMNDIEVRPADQSQYRRTSQPDLAEGISLDALGRFANVIPSFAEKLVKAGFQETKETGQMLQILKLKMQGKATPEQVQWMNKQWKDLVIIALGVGMVGYSTAAAAAHGGVTAALGHGAKDAVLHSLADIGLEQAAEVLAAKFGIDIVKKLAHSTATSTGQDYEHHQAQALQQYGVSPAVAAQNHANLEKKFKQAKMGFGGMSESTAQTNPNEVAELLYKVKPEIFSRFGDDFVMDAITQACEQHIGSAQEVAVKVVDILKQGLSEAASPAQQAAIAISKKKEQSVDEGEEEALAYATKAHAGQTRSGGDPYITHPMRVADHIRKYKQSHNLDALISAAYLHDTIEDTSTTQEALHDLFGGLVASLVQELTSDPAQIKKMGKAAYLSHKMAAMSSYGLVIKLADRLDNVKDITTAKTPEWRHKYAAETNQILNYIEKTRALSGTHKKLIELIRAKLAEIDNPQQGVEEAFPSGAKDPWEEYEFHHDGEKIGHIYSKRNDPPFTTRRKVGRFIKQMKHPTRQAAQEYLINKHNEIKNQGVAEGSKYKCSCHPGDPDPDCPVHGLEPMEVGDALDVKKGVKEAGITRRGILKGIGAAAAAGAAGKAGAIAGAFPTPSHQAAMYKAAADSNAAQARADAAAKAKADAKRLQQGTQDVERLNKVNYHGGNSPKPTNATWDGDSDFLDLDGTQYTMASRMPISGNEPRDMQLIATREGHQVYIWTRYRMKGDGGHYFYPAEKPSTINEFAPGNGDDDKPNAEYEVYQCQLDDQFDWIGGPLLQTDRMDKAHGYAYNLWKKHPDKCFMIWQERSQGSRGGYGPKGSVLAPSEDDVTENTDYLDEK